MTRALIFVLLLAGCAELPLMEGTISPAARAQPSPVLVPLDPLLAQGRRRSVAQEAQAPLSARGAALSRSTIASPGTADLAARGSRLRERAATLRAQPV